MGKAQEPARVTKRKRGDIPDDSSSSLAPEFVSPAKKPKATPKKTTTSNPNEEEGFTPKKTEKAVRDPNQEKRLRRFRPTAPKAFFDVYERATAQRFFVISRSRTGTGEDEEETVELAGSTGNIYTVTIARQPTCDCPHAKAGNQCKHVLYVLKRVLRAKFDYVYQLALLGSEVREILDTAGPIPSEEGEEGASAEQKEDPNRKPIEGDCPICYEELGTAGEAIVWCKASCGQNIHKACIEMWAATKRQQGSSKVTCPYCRSDWEGDTDMVRKIEKTGKIGAEGYRNVADQLGISTVRDTSSYSAWWSGHPGGGRRNGFGRGGWW